jgi:murein L,D-transpeptidase YafK
MGRTMRAVRVAAGVAVVMAMVVGCSAPKKRPAPSPLIADDDRLEWASQEPWFVVVRKACRTLDVYSYGRRIRSYPAVFGDGGTRERKMFAGDHRTPTGLYMIIGARPHERWGYFFLLDYPNAHDASVYQQALAQGTIPAAGLGSAVGIHGTDKPWLNRENIDWTWGCISLDNDAIDEFARMVWVGTPVLIED